MKKYLFCSAILFSVIGFSLIGQANNQQEEDRSSLTLEEQAIQNAEKNLFTPETPDILHFQMKWLKQELEKSKDKNFVISPVSLYQALALFGHGLNGYELKNAMHYSTDGMVIQIQNHRIGEEDAQNTLKPTLLPLDKASFRIRLSKDMMSDEQVKITNSIWGNSFLREFTEDVKKYLNAEAKPLPKNTRVINEWIEEKTKGKIKNLLQNKETSPLELFLVNTIYFKANWMNKFDIYRTRKMPFNTQNGPVEVDMMYDKKRIDYYEDEMMQAIRLPYWGPLKDGRYLTDPKHSMIFILPKEHVSWNDFISKLSIQDFYLNFIERMPVKIYLPRFKVEYQQDDMIEVLKNMGLERIFKEGAFLGSKTPGTLLTIVHKSIISVDEEGTEAAAATVAGIMETGLLNNTLKRTDPYFIFKADRPFIFMLDEGLFVGVVNNPNEN